MSIRHAVLALLAESPLHGYAVPEALERRFGATWAIDASRAYQVLGSLARAGLVVRSSERVGRRPPRRVYALSDAGRAALRDWLRSPLAPREDAVADLVLRLRLAPSLREPFLDDLLARAIAGARRTRARLCADGEDLPAHDIAAVLEHFWMARRQDGTLEALEACRLALADLRAGKAAASIARSLVERSRPARRS